MNAVVRLAGVADREAIVGLLVAQLRDHGVATPETNVARTVDLLLCRPHRGCFLAATDAGCVVGVAAVSFGFPIEHGGRGAWLEELYVAPAARGRRVGEQLLEAALQVAMDGGAIAIDLEVARGHERVESLYQRAGFTRLGRARWARPLVARSSQKSPPPAQVSGGCFCEAVRYEVRGAPREVSHCHCSMCRRAAGAPVVTWATYPLPALRWVTGTPAALHSSPPVTRSFCRDCGTALAFFTTDEPNWIDVTVASMDQAAEVRPNDHIWCDDRLPWLVLDDDLPRLRRGHSDRS